ncbi:MAG: glycine cleavage system protein GcvH [Acidimicrobiia bacterium]|nr:glycine cleavage system protein GcvH [Acidimicrobiia bacterium]
MDLPEDLHYTQEHEWCRIEVDSKVRVGITDYAQDALGDVVYVQLPEVGDVLRAGGTFGEVESTKSVSDLWAPISGTVAEVNPLLQDAPELVNSAPYGDGWMVVIEAADPSEVANLLDAAGYRAYLDAQSE